MPSSSPTVESSGSPRVEGETQPAGPLLERSGEFILQLLSGSSEGLEALSPEEIQRRQFLADLLRYGTIVVAIALLMILYPFIQRHFVKGIMVGSIKG